jgi:hypothetical protein
MHWQSTRLRNHIWIRLFHIQSAGMLVQKLRVED